jgi:hypothetical protein
MNPEPKLNTLIPMEDTEGNRCFVNAWDVTSRKQDGWRVLGDERKHTSMTTAPVDVLTGDDGKDKGKGKKAPVAPPAPPAPPAS